jgi:hypothetical protein
MLETKIQELTTEISELKMAIINLKEVMFSMPAQATKPTKKAKAKIKEEKVELPVESFIEESLQQPEQPKQPEPQSTITKQYILEVAKAKLTEGKATKEDIKGIISSQGYDSLSEITNQEDFAKILKLVKDL